MAVIHQGFDVLRQGSFGNAGANLFVDSSGAVRRIAEQDLNGDGLFDIIFANSHGFDERGPTSIYTQVGSRWVCRDLPHDSCWKTRAVDVDGDGYPDLLIANGENGVSSLLTSFLYWGGPQGLTGERAEFPTEGAYDAVALDLTGNGLKDLIFTSAWADHHFPGYAFRQKVYVQESPRVFREATEEFDFNCISITSLAVEDLTGNGYPDLVMAGYKSLTQPEGVAYIYYGGPEGLAREPVTLPTYWTGNMLAADLFGTGRKDLIFAGGKRVLIYPNRQGRFSQEDMITLVPDPTPLESTVFNRGRIAIDAADIDGDGVTELLIGCNDGIQIRKASSLDVIWQQIGGFPCTGLKAYDFQGKGKMDIAACCYASQKSYDTDSFLIFNVNDTYSLEHAQGLLTHGAINVDVADLDGDGRAEIIFCNTMRGFNQRDPEFPVFCYYGNAQGIYGPEARREYPVDSGAYSYVIADVNNDGFPELVVTTWDGARIFLGGPEGPDPGNYYDIHEPLFRMPGGVILADINGDGWLDLILSTGGREEVSNSSVTLYWGGPDGFKDENHRKLPVNLGCAQALVLVDINGDGWLDLACGDNHGQLLILYGEPEGLGARNTPINIPMKNANGVNLIGLTAVDLNTDGKYELVSTSCGHYTRKKSYLNILRDPENGFPLEKQISLDVGGTTGYVTFADLRGSGCLDMIVPFYATTETRELPMRIFRNDGAGNFDFENPLQIPCLSSIASLTMDLNRNGYPDLLICCHRNDLGHIVDSLLVSNGPEGLDLEHPQKLLGYGPHDFSRNIIYNAMDRSESEYYTSAAVPWENETCALTWEAQVPGDTALRFRVRAAADASLLEQTQWSELIDQGAAVTLPKDTAWLQYQAEFFAPNACGSPRLTKVEVF